MSAYLRLRPDLLRRRERRFVPRGDLSRCSNMRGQTALLDQLISPNQQSQWHLNPKRLGSL